METDNARLPLSGSAPTTSAWHSSQKDHTPKNDVVIVRLVTILPNIFIYINKIVVDKNIIYRNNFSLDSANCDKDNVSVGIEFTQLAKTPSNAICRPIWLPAWVLPGSFFAKVAPRGLEHGMLLCTCLDGQIHMWGKPYTLKGAITALGCPEQ